jgi:hypothetical protein
VTEPRKPAPPIAWDTIERAAGKGDRARIEAMAEAEVDEDLRKAGIDPERAASVVERALNEGAPQSETETPAAAKGESAAAPPPLRSIEGGAPGATPQAKASRVARWAPWVGATALAACVLLVLANQHDDGVGQGNPGPPPSDSHRAAPVQPDTPAGHAARMRANAAGACAEERWEICERLLNQATDLDPAGESTPMVIGLRRQLAHVNRDAR